MNMLSISTWLAPTLPLEPPEPGKLHIWRIAVETPGMDLAHLLAHDEALRKQQMLSPQERIRFSNARGGLRAILSAYLGIPPNKVSFHYGPKGKPLLNHSKSFHFNLTHAGDLALLAISCDCEVGIDLEKQTRRNNLRKIAQRVFPAKLWRVLELLKDESFDQAFFLHWTELEARVKALGLGVFTRESLIDTVQCMNFQPQTGWCAAVATVGLLPEPDDWCTFQFTPDLLGQLG
ncbi:4'-phosphopantetheinyl transferase family protein [Sedimenticola selenatireducens]|uniref:4'-phosphopantetheinyl transferase superfamily protein n=1 Tax=Sedimenticola selenatireducens TaxID=191960 RepID=A0A558DQ28_9GAMM|nr:4'-phosphopantetheinyl transferase superfamily protein [Sedimenticola selenatireducens]TVO70547.1 4'-phosphopantetheinyl transferase superfamily protein [Sedimenticola selenatireducens]TVT63124.1 MAG: 4'-phosphopantetheinyl transferase superfamily protein [Sedimenticola selenatireducens]